MITHKNNILLILLLDYLENGEDLGITSTDLQDRFDYSFGLSRASTLLKELFGSGLLRRKLEKFPSGGKRYRYFLTSDGFKKADYIYEKYYKPTLH